MGVYDKDKEDGSGTVIELYVVLKGQYKNTKITHQSNFTVGTQVQDAGSTGCWYIQGCVWGGGACQSSAGVT